MLLLGLALSAASIVVFRIEMELEVLLACLYASNMGFLWSILYVIWLSEKENLVDSFGRVRCVILFLCFAQSVVFVFGFSDGVWGG